MKKETTKSEETNVTPIAKKAELNGHDGNRASKKARYKFEFPVKLDIIGGIIKGFRKMRNLSQENLGALVGVKKSQISKIEKGDKNLTIGTIIKLLRALRAKVTFKIELDNKKELKLIEQIVLNKEQGKDQSVEGYS